MVGLLVVEKAVKMVAPSELLMAALTAVQSVVRSVAPSVYLSVAWLVA